MGQVSRSCRFFSLFFNDHFEDVINVAALKLRGVRQNLLAANLEIKQVTDGRAFDTEVQRLWIQLSLLTTEQILDLETPIPRIVGTRALGLAVEGCSPDWGVKKNQAAAMSRLGSAQALVTVHEEVFQ